MTETTIARLNDVDIGRVASLAQKISGEPDVGATKWAAEVTWDGGFRSVAKVRDFAPTQSDEPEQLGGTDTAANPVEQVLSALGNCLAVGYAANATIAGITIRSLKISVEGDLDLHAFLGLREGHAGFETIAVKVDMDSDGSPEALAALHEKVTATSPVGHTLGRALPVDIKMV